MAGQYNTNFLTKISEKTFQSSTFATQSRRSSNNHFSSYKFTLLSLLLLTLHTHCATAGPLQRIPNDSSILQDDSAQLNKVVDIPKINSHLGLFQGDIKLSRMQQSIYEVITTRKFYPQTPLPEKMIHYWEYGLIYYDTSSITDARVLNLIELAISSLKTETNCLIFLRADRSTTDYIQFTDNDGCWSYLGRQGGPQEVALGSSSCQHRNVIVHLILHAIGFVHEESRPDRDRNIVIDFNNVEPGRETNFDILPEELARTNGTNYNYNSIMHSLKKTSSQLTRDGYKQTIRALLSLRGANFGTISSLTPIDVTRVKALYCPYSVNSGHWTEWSVWSTCSVSCNSGNKYRTRICYKPDSSYVCAGSNYEVGRCHKYACVGLGRSEWGSWGQWSRCSASCGGGLQVRVRPCLGGDVCTRGKGRQYRSCGLYRCPGSRWNSWSQWAPCSQSCHYGKTTRERQCNGDNCTGSSSQTRICNYKTPCAPVWNQWSEWDTCTNGFVTRTRSCRLPPYKCRGPHTEHIACSTEGKVPTEGVNSTGELVPTGSWSSWSPCTSSCGPGEQTRSNSCGQTGECRQVRRCQITTRCAQET